MYKFYFQVKFVDSDRIRIIQVTTNYTERNWAKETATGLVAAAFGHEDFEISAVTFQTLIDRMQFDDDGIEVVDGDLKAKIGEQEIRIESLEKTVSNQIGIIESLKTTIAEQNDELRSEFNR